MLQSPNILWKTCIFLRAAVVEFMLEGRRSWSFVVGENGDSGTTGIDTLHKEVKTATLYSPDLFTSKQQVGR